MDQTPFDHKEYGDRPRTVQKKACLPQIFISVLLIVFLFLLIYFLIHSFFPELLLDNEKTIQEKIFQHAAEEQIETIKENTIDIVSNTVLTLAPQSAEELLQNAITAAPMAQESISEYANTAVPAVKEDAIQFANTARPAIQSFAENTKEKALGFYQTQSANDFQNPKATISALSQNIQPTAEVIVDFFLDKANTGLDFIQTNIP